MKNEILISDKEEYTDEYFMKKYPEKGKQLAKAYKVRSRTCLYSFIKKYGEKEGIERYFSWKKKCSHNKDFFIEKYGEKEGMKKYTHFKNNSSTTLEKCIEKYGEKEGKLKWDEMCYKKGNCNRIEFYVNKGYSIEEAKKIVYNKQHNASVARYKKEIDRSSFEYRSTFNTCIEFYIQRGYTKEDALKELHKRQETFSLSKCIEKFGQEEGLIKFQERQKKWQNTLNSKSYEEKINIEKRKYNSLAFSSSASIKFFDKLIKLLNENNYKFDKIYYKDNEYLIWDDNTSRVYFYDFVIPDIKYACEYNGIKFHPKPNFSDYEKLQWKSLYTNKNYEECLKFDNYKNNLIQNNGFYLDIVWEDEDIDMAIKRIFNNIKEKYDR